MGPVDPLDPRTSERLLRGRAHPDDVPQDYREVAHLLQALGGDLDPVGTVDPTVPDFRQRVRRVGVRSLGVKTAAAVTFVALTGTAAAATGRLPDAAQNGLAGAARRVGIHLPVTHSGHPPRKPKAPVAAPTNEGRPSPAPGQTAAQPGKSGVAGAGTSGIATNGSRRGATTQTKSVTSPGALTGPPATTSSAVTPTHSTPTTGRPSQPGSDRAEPPSSVPVPTQPSQSRPEPPPGAPPVGGRAADTRPSADPHR